MAVKVQLEGTLQSIDWTKPDNLNVIWPLYRDPKIDIAVLLKGMLDENGMSNFPVIKEGAFAQSMLFDESNRPLPVIVISRATDSAQRLAIGDIAQYLILDANTNQLVDVSDKILKTLPVGSAMLWKCMTYNVNVVVDIFCVNQQLADQVYGFAKTALFAAELEFINQLGYLDFLQTGGGDGDTLAFETQGGPHMVFHRTLTFTCRIVNFIAGLPALLNLIKSTYLGKQVQPDGSAEQSLNL